MAKISHTDLPFKSLAIIISHTDMPFKNSATVIEEQSEQSSSFRKCHPCHLHVRG